MLCCNRYSSMFHCTRFFYPPYIYWQTWKGEDEECLNAAAQIQRRTIAACYTVMAPDELSRFSDTILSHAQSVEKFYRCLRCQVDRSCKTNRSITPSQAPHAATYCNAIHITGCRKVKKDAPTDNPILCLVHTICQQLMDHQAYHALYHAVENGY